MKNPCTMCCLKFKALVIATPLQCILWETPWFFMSQCGFCLSEQVTLLSQAAGVMSDDLSRICFGAFALGKLPSLAWSLSLPPLKYNSPERIWDSLTHRAPRHYLHPLYLCMASKYLSVASVLLPNSHLYNTSAFLIKYRSTICLPHQNKISLRMEALS